MNIVPLTDTQQGSMYPVGEHMIRAISFVNEAYPLIFEKIDQPYVNIWVTGSSGAILGGLLANQLLNINKLRGVRVMHIKKEGEMSHTTNHKRGYMDNANNIMIDDDVASGHTLNYIYSEIEKAYGREKMIKIDVLAINMFYKTDKWYLNFEPTTLITNIEGLQFAKEPFLNPKINQNETVISDQDQLQSQLTQDGNSTTLQKNMGWSLLNLLNRDTYAFHGWGRVRIS